MNSTAPTVKSLTKTVFTVSDNYQERRDAMLELAAVYASLGDKSQVKRFETMAEYTTRRFLS